LGEDMRHSLSFVCEGNDLAATLDEAPGTTGLLIVSGGNEVRIGAHRGMAKLAQDVAAAGFPVFRFDRRGIGDSDGRNGGFQSSKPDMLAAISAFRAQCPTLKCIIAFGNCDAATALRLHLTDEVDGLVLANPWLIDAAEDGPPPSVARAYYAQRLLDPKAWLGLLRGAVRLGGLLDSLKSASKSETSSSLARDMARKMDSAPLPTSILLAAHDGTAVAFKAQWNGPLFQAQRGHIAPVVLDSSSHSFASDADYAALRSAVLAMLGSTK
jgi:exosortase A-associated hydrolase 1